MRIKINMERSNQSMKVVKITSEIKNQAALLILSIPMFILNLWVVQRSNNIKLEIQDFLQGKLFALLTIFTVWAAFNLYSLLKARKVSFWSNLFLALTVIVIDTNIVILRKNYALAFYVLFLVITTALYLLANWKLLAQPFFNSKRRWFEGLPKFYPGIKAEISDGQDSYPASVSNLSEVGCFIYSASELSKIELLELSFGGQSCSTHVNWITSSKEGFGAGLRFTITSLDQEKELKEFIDSARSMGYVD